MPAAQLIGVQVMTSPPSENVPIAQSSQSVAEEGVATDFWPAGQFMVLSQDRAEPPLDHWPTSHAVQPSVAEVAPPVTGAAYWKAEQVMSEHVVNAPPVENLPVGHSVQSVAEVAAVLLAIEPAGQLLAVQDELAPVSEYVPGRQFVQPSVSDVAAILVEY